MQFFVMKVWFQLFPYPGSAAYPQYEPAADARIPHHRDFVPCKTPRRFWYPLPIALKFSTWKKFAVWAVRSRDVQPSGLHELNVYIMPLAGCAGGACLTPPTD